MRQPADAYPFPTFSVPVRFGIAVITLTAVVVIDRTAGALIDNGSHLILLATAVMATALFAGTGPALGATVVAAVLGARHDSGSDNAAAPMHLALFLVHGLLVTAVVAELRRARRESEVRAQEAQTAKEDGENAHRMKDEFLSIVSHELRTPLTSIYGFAETLLREDISFGEDERRTFLSYIASEAQQLTGIVDALLSVARLEAGDLQVQLAPTDLRDVVSDVVSSAERELVNGGRFVIDVPEEPLDAAADREKVRQILANLVDNAVKFSPQGGTVTIAARRTADAVQVRVVDEGSGVPPGEQERIFRKFYRADAVGPAGGGSGLGLFIARGLASAMGGRLWMDSETGEGASFVFELPTGAVREQ
jgi:signal transduction histidine kinase